MKITKCIFFASMAIFALYGIQIQPMARCWNHVVPRINHAKSLHRPTQSINFAKQVHTSTQPIFAPARPLNLNVASQTLHTSTQPIINFEQRRAFHTSTPSQFLFKKKKNKKNTAVKPVKLSKLTRLKNWSKNSLLPDVLLGLSAIVPMYIFQLLPIPFWKRALLTSIYAAFAAYLMYDARKGVKKIADTLAKIVEEKTALGIHDGLYQGRISLLIEDINQKFGQDISKNSTLNIEQKIEISRNFTLDIKEKIETIKEQAQKIKEHSDRVTIIEELETISRKHTISKAELDQLEASIDRTVLATRSKMPLIKR